MTPTTPHPPTAVAPGPVLHPQQSLLHRLRGAANTAHRHEGVGVQEVGRQVLHAVAEGGAEHGRLPASAEGMDGEILGVRDWGKHG